MKIEDMLVSGCEDFKYQPDSKLFKSLTECLSTLTNSVLVPKGDRRLDKLSGIIFKETGILTKIVITTAANSWSPMVTIPTVSNQHVLVSDFRRIIIGLNTKSADIIRKTPKVGWVDRSNGTVGGVFSKIECTIFLPLNCLKKSFITPTALAGGLIHEIGHVWTYFDQLAETLRMNWLVEHTTRLMLGTDSDDDRREYLKVFEETSGAKFGKDEGIVVQEKNGDKIRTMLINPIIQGIKSTTKSELFDVMAYEIQSDKFATMHGAGPALAQALEVMGRKLGAKEYRNTGRYLMFEVIKLVAFLSIGFFSKITAVVLLLITNPWYADHPHPYQRLEFIEESLNNVLRDRDLDDKTKKQVLSDIALVRASYKTCKERMTLSQFCWKYILPVGRREFKAFDIQRSLGGLTNNGLYASAAKLTTIY